MAHTRPRAHFSARLGDSVSIPPISTIPPRASVGSPGFVCVSGAPLWREVSLGA
nr:MAG TPA: hypothetical protein [Caudoviricetes sp.]